MKLAVQLLGGEQRCPRVLGLGIGRHQRERGDVVAGDPGGAGRVEYLGPVPQPQLEPVTLHEADPQGGALSEFAAARRRIEHRLEQRLGGGRGASVIVDWHVAVRQQVRLRSSDASQHFAP